MVQDTVCTVQDTVCTVQDMVCTVQENLFYILQMIQVVHIVAMSMTT